MRIKVCGMREAVNIRAVDALGVDYMGFIFYPRSSRYVTVKPSIMPCKAKRVGVFVDATTADIIDHITTFDLDVVQLHGNESPDFCQQLRMEADNLIYNKIDIWKAISVESGSDLKVSETYADVVNAFVFDTKCTSYGGSGLQYDWNILCDYTCHIPFLLSGGIGPDDVERLRLFHHPQFAGIDLNSRFESAPAVKDIDKLDAFIKRVIPEFPDSPEVPNYPKQ